MKKVVGKVFIKKLCHREIIMTDFATETEEIFSVRFSAFV